MPTKSLSNKNRTWESIKAQLLSSPKYNFNSSSRNILRIDGFYSFMRKLDSGCWLWVGCAGGSGYGIFRLYNTNFAAHRMAWMIANDRLVPDGMIVCHTCDNKLCVNPTHLFVGTQQDNMDDMRSKGREAHMFGRIIPEIVRDKISKTLTGRRLPSEVKDKISNSLLGIKKSAETKKRMSEAQKLRFQIR